MDGDADIQMFRCYQFSSCMVSSPTVERHTLHAPPAIRFPPVETVQKEAVAIRCQINPPTSTCGTEPTIKKTMGENRCPFERNPWPMEFPCGNSSRLRVSSRFISSKEFPWSTRWRPPFERLGYIPTFPGPFSHPILPPAPQLSLSLFLSSFQVLLFHISRSIACSTDGATSVRSPFIGPSLPLALDRR